MPVQRSAAVARAEQRKLRLAKARAERDRRAKARKELAAETKATIAAARPVVTKKQRAENIRREKQAELRARIPTARPQTSKVNPLSKKEKRAIEGEAIFPKDVRRDVERSARKTKPKHLEYLTGPSAATPGFQKGDILDLGLMLPFGRPVAGVRAGVRGAVALKGGARAAGAAAKTEYKAGSLVKRAVQASRKTRPTRTLRVNEKVQQLPTARSRVTRALIERPADAISRRIAAPEVPAQTLLGRPVSGGRAIKEVRPRTVAEAQARLAALQVEEDKAVKLFMKEGPFDPRPALRGQNLDPSRAASQRMARNKNLKRGKEPIRSSIYRDAYGGGTPAERKYEEAASQFRQFIAAKLAKNPNHATLKKFQAQFAEMDALKFAIDDATLPEFGKTPGASKGSLGTEESLRSVTEFSTPTFRSGSQGRAAAVARRLLPTATVEARVAKAAGQAQTRTAERTAAQMSGHIRALPKSGSAEDVAHSWWAQLPKSHRNAEGLKLVRGKQAEELAEITSGRALVGIQRQIAAVGAKIAKIKEARAAGEEGEENIFDLYSEIGALKELASDLPNRVEDISVSLGQLDRVIAKPPALDDQVIEAVRALSGDRKQVLTASGILDPGKAAAREGLVSRWLGVEPTGEEAFLGHRLGKVRGSQPSLMPISVGTGRVRIPQGVARENKLVLAKTGRLRPSTHVAAEDWQAAQVYRQATTARDDLAQMGSRFTGRLPDGHLLINPKGRAVPPHWKTDMLAKIPEGDEEAVYKAAQEIVQGFSAGPLEVDAMLAAAKKAGVNWDELRVVPESLVKRYYGQFTPAGGASKIAKAYDAAVDFTAASIIFARVGYIPKNIVQNLIMAVPHQGPFLLMNIPRAAAVLLDPELRHLLHAEVGFSGRTAGIGQELRFGQAARGVPAKTAGFVGKIADDPMRMSAFIHEAAAGGIIKRYSAVLDEADKANLLRLLTDKSMTPRLNDIRSRSVEAMADFSRLTPQQRRWARRFLIIPGWLWAGSRYPFHFAATHPGRSAAIGYAAAGMPYADKVGLPQTPSASDLSADDLPPFVEGIRLPGGKVLRTTSLDPVTTPFDIAGAAVGGSPRTVLDYANPLASSLYNIAGRRASYPGGSYQTDYATSLERNLERLVPNVTFARQLISPSGEGRYPEDATRLGRIKRELGVLPIEIRPELTVSDKAKAKIAEEREEMKTLMGEVSPQALKGGKLPPAINRAFTRKQAVEVLRAEIGHEFAKKEQAEERNRGKFSGELDILVKWGAMKPREAAGAKKWAKSADLEDVKGARLYLQGKYFEDAYLRLLHDSTKYLKERQ